MPEVDAVREGVGDALEPTVGDGEGDGVVGHTMRLTAWVPPPLTHTAPKASNATACGLLILAASALPSHCEAE